MIVANTFTRNVELASYLRLCDDVVIVHATGTWVNGHGVPAEMIRRMIDRWERFATDNDLNVARNDAMARPSGARRVGWTDGVAGTRRAPGGLERDRRQSRPGTPPRVGGR